MILIIDVELQNKANSAITRVADTDHSLQLLKAQYFEVNRLLAIANEHG